MSDPTFNVTQLLHAARDGDAASLDRVFPLVYGQLRRLAAKVRRGRAGETLSTTALVHEAYIKLVPGEDLDFGDRARFFRIAARAMRQILVDAARRRSAGKRGGGERAVTLHEEIAGSPIRDVELLDLDAALAVLEEMSPRQARIVECRYFAGLSVDETAAAVGLSVPTVVRDWRAARAWLKVRLHG